MLGSWSSIAKNALKCAYTMLFETSCYNRRFKNNSSDRSGLMKMTRMSWDFTDQKLKLETVVLRFTSLMFGLSLSSSVLEGTIKYHLGWYQTRLTSNRNGAETKYICWRRNWEWDNVDSAKTFEENIVQIFNEAGFKLHKWHSNVAELEEEDDISEIETDETYAKQQLSKGDREQQFLEFPVTSKMIS